MSCVGCVYNGRLSEFVFHCIDCLAGSNKVASYFDSISDRIMDIESIQAQSFECYKVSYAILLTHQWEALGFIPKTHDSEYVAREIFEWFYKDDDKIPIDAKPITIDVNWKHPPIYLHGYFPILRLRTEFDD